jgi:putative DNA primase/helicase
MLALAANRRQFAITADKLDSDAWLMGADDLTFDLRTCTKREPRREDLITKAIGAEYDRNATCPTWIKFQNRIFDGNQALIAYVKRAVGYCLTGSMVEQIFFFCYGLGANGKSVFLAILRALLGEYAKQADFSTFLVQRNEKVRNDLAALAGARVITATEAEEGGRLSMQVIKAWTGADPITARYLFAEYFTFQPTGKIWLAANNRPAVTERNLAAWRRVRLIPFNVTIPESEQDKELESKLLQELPGILNWAMEGLQDYLQNGLDTPKAVQDATNEYRQENDSLEQFVSECCELGKLKVCKNSDLFGQYLNFCGMSGLKALSQKTFSLELSARAGIKSTRSKHGMTWTGIALKSEWCRVEDDPTSLARDAKDVGLKQNAQPSSNSSTRGDFAHLTNDPTPHSDSDPTPPHTTPKTEDKAGFEKFKRNMAKRKCCLCGRTFPYDLTPYYNNGVSSYICTSCHMHGQPSEPQKADAQVKLSEVA